MNFGQALEALKNGEVVTRQGWNGKKQWLELQMPDKNSKMKSPYIFISPVNKMLVPWVASQTDMLAEDWKQLDRMHLS